MSDNTSQNSPTSSRVWTNEIEHYDGALEIEKNWYEGLKPDPFMAVSEWSDKYRFLSSKSAAEPGRWRTKRTPYLKEIMDCLSVSSPIQRVVFMKGAQVGGTEAGNNWVGYVIHIAPGPMMAVSPTVEMAKRNSRQRIDPQIEDVPELRERVAPARSRDSGNTVLSKEFPGGVLVMTGANSAVGLRSMPARYLFMDEVDGYPGDVEGEGDPILLAERRSATFQRRRKVLLVSTPTIKGLSRIQREFEASDQRYYQVPCPECGFEQALRFTQMRWPEGKPDETKYCCESCGVLIDEHHKTKMLAKGRWVPTAEGDGRTQGYHLSSLYSPVGWFSWADAARLFEVAKSSPDLMKGFVNTVLGEPYEEEFEAPEWERIYERREKYPIGVVPADGLFLTAGVDIQRDRIECEVVAWGRNKISWSIDYQVLDGDTAQQAVWGGAGARASQPRTAVAIKGRDQDTALILSVSKADTGGKRKGLRVWNVSGPVAKVELYRWLKLPRLTDEELDAGEDYPPGTCHYPEYGEEYFKQLTAERRVIRLHKGFPKATWEKDPARNNEALDCRVYARSAASIYGLDRFKEIHWKRLEKAMGVITPSLKQNNEIKQSQSIQREEKSRPKLMQRPSALVDDPYL